LIGLGLALIFLFALGSSMWRCASGPASETEDAIFFRGNRVLRLAVLLLSVIGICFPSALFLAVVWQVFPFGERTTLTLQSRYRIADGSATADADRQGWEAFARAEPQGRLLDAGPLVDRILQRLQAEGVEPLQPGNQALAEIARRIVIEEARRARPEFSLGELPPGSSQAPGTGTTLPGWLVESVEFATLRLLTEQVNTGKIAFLSAGRRDLTGHPTWRIFEDYLRSAERLRGADRNVKIFNDGTELSYPALTSASLNQSATGRVLLLSIAVPRLAATTSDDVQPRAGYLSSGSELSASITLRRHSNSFDAGDDCPTEREALGPRSLWPRICARKISSVWFLGWPGFQGSSREPKAAETYLGSCGPVC
jgi:hypothetical protein